MKLKIVALALIAALGFGVVAATAAKPKKVKSSVTINFKPGNSGNPADPYAESSFKGKVKSKKKKCRKGRTVVVKEVGEGKVGQDKTNKKGKYSVPGGGALGPGEYDEPGQFFAKAKKKKKGNTICKAAKSRRITAP